MVYLQLVLLPLWATEVQCEHSSLPPLPAITTHKAGGHDLLMLHPSSCDHDNKMDLGFTSQEVADVRLVFDLFDASKQGSVQLEDLRKALRLLGFKVSREKVQQIASDVQTPGSRDLVRGRTDFTAFLQVLSKLQGTSYDKHGEIVQVRAQLVHYSVYGVTTVCRHSLALMWMVMAT